MDRATFAVHHDIDHFFAGGLAEQAGQTSSQYSEGMGLHDPLHSLSVGSFIATWGGPEEPTAQVDEDDDLPSPWGQRSLSPTSQSQHSELQQTTDMACAQTPISLQEKVVYPGFGCISNDEPPYDFHEANAENDHEAIYAAGSCTSVNTATTGGSQRYVGPSQIFRKGTLSNNYIV